MASSLVLNLSSSANAASVPPPGPTGAGSRYASCDFGVDKSIEECIISINKDIMGAIIAVVVVISVFMLPFIVLNMTSGDPQKIQSGKDALYAWITGFLLIVFSGIIIIIVLSEMLLVA